MILFEKEKVSTKMAVNAYVVQARCKINLHLGVQERRPDGYHDVESIFLPLDFGDILSFDLLEQPETCDLRVFWNIPHRKYEEIPMEKNLVYKAVSLFREKTGWKQGIRIVLEKRVPPGAGLGGGSADAAATLRTLDTLAGTRLPFEVLSGMAAELGSDAPFFLYNSPAFVSGRGEYIRTIKYSSTLWIALVVPGFESGTAPAFRLLDKERENGVVMTPCNGSKPSMREEDLIEGLKDHPSKWRYYNDFLPIFLKGEHKKEYGVVLETLKNGGADFCGLSGSGSSCFGIFTLKKTAEYIRKLLSQDKIFVKITHFPLDFCE